MFNPFWTYLGFAVKDPPDILAKKYNGLYYQWCVSNGMDGEINSFPLWLESLSEQELSEVFSIDSATSVALNMIQEEIDRRVERVLLVERNLLTDENQETNQKP